MNIRYRNMTGHSVNVYSRDDVPVLLRTFDRGKKVLRVVHLAPSEQYSPALGTSIVTSEVSRLYAEAPVISGMIYIVSFLTALACRRADMVYPMGKIRDGGITYGCHGLGTVLPYSEFNSAEVVTV